MNGERLPMEELRSIIDAFVERVVEDPMIGFFFNSIPKERLKQRELEFAAAWMGHPIAYTGRPLKQAHTQHPIKGGHFDRRKKILQETLNEFDVPSALKEAWLSHTDALRAQITQDAESQCDAVATRLDALNRPDGPLAMVNSREGDSK